MAAPLQIGRYVLHGEIASGGMASVHYGRLVGTGGFTKTVAIKRLHRALAQTPSFRKMILEEGRLAARVRHPNVVPPLDVLAEGGELLLVMEYVHGESLSRLLRAAWARRRARTAAGRRGDPVQRAARAARCARREGRSGQAARHRSSRCLAAEHHRRRRRRRARDRLRHREGGHVGGDDHRGHHQGQGAVPLAGAARGRSGDEAHRHLRRRRGVLGGARGAASLRGRGRRRRAPPDHDQEDRRRRACSIRSSPARSTTSCCVVSRAIRRIATRRRARWRSRSKRPFISRRRRWSAPGPSDSRRRRSRSAPSASVRSRRRRRRRVWARPGLGSGRGCGRDRRHRRRDARHGAHGGSATGVPGAVGAPPRSKPSAAPPASSQPSSRSQGPPPPLPAGDACLACAVDAATAAARVRDAGHPGAAREGRASHHHSAGSGLGARSAAPRRVSRSASSAAHSRRVGPRVVAAGSAADVLTTGDRAAHRDLRASADAGARVHRGRACDLAPGAVPPSPPPSSPLSPPPAGALRKPELAIRNVDWLPPQEQKAPPGSLFRRFLSYLAIFLVLALIVAWMFAPAIARAWIVTGAASRGIVVTIDRVDVSRKAIRLLDVHAESAELPGASLRAGTFVINLRWLVPDSISIDDAEVSLDGSYGTIATRFAQYRAKHGAQLVEPLAGIQKIEVTSGHIDWKNVVGEGTSALIENITVDVTKNPIRPLGDDYHLPRAALHDEARGRTGGAVADRRRSPGDPRPHRGAVRSVGLVSGDDHAHRGRRRFVSIALAVPPTSLSDLHIPAAVVGKPSPIARASKRTARSTSSPCSRRRRAPAISPTRQARAAAPMREPRPHRPSAVTSRSASRGVSSSGPSAHGLSVGPADRRLARSAAHGRRRRDRCRSRGCSVRGGGPDGWLEQGGGDRADERHARRRRSRRPHRARREDAADPVREGAGSGGGGRREAPPKPQRTLNGIIARSR